MRVLKAFCWSITFLLAWTLIVLAAWHSQLQNATAHRLVMQSLLPQRHISYQDIETDLVFAPAALLTRATAATRRASESLLHAGRR